GQNTIVGLDDVKIEVLDKLTGPQTNRLIIPIVGMGGIGKTTLARIIYLDPLIKDHFDILAWATISQDYNAKEILLAVLLCLKITGSGEISRRMSEHELGEKVYRKLFGRRYLIIVDDIWSTEITGSRGFELNFLDKDKSWNLLRIIVFGEEGCPLELEETGKKIAKNCKGLPLSINVIGGLLSKSEPTQESWEYVAGNLNSKAIFLYMGIFREDSVIRFSDLIDLWVSEGFLKPIRGKSLEIVAEEYLKELIDRNLVLIHSQSFNGKIKWCNMHDLLRDLCLREAQKDKFLFVTRQCEFDISQGIRTQRRIGIHAGTRPQVIDSLPSASLARSFVCDIHFQDVVPLLNFRLLRVLRAWRVVDQKSHVENPDNRYRVKAIFQLVNSRLLAVDSDWGWLSRVPSSIYLLWNLQTLIVKGNYQVVAPSEIWKMPQLRHIKFDELYLPNPPPFSHMEGWSRYSLDNLGLLHNLESLSCCFDAFQMQSGHELVQNLTFPHSLKELTLQGCCLNWEDITTKIGSIPLLEVLKLKFKSVIGKKWETVEGQFCSLKLLLIRMCDELEYWNTDSTHFPRLERLRLEALYNLKEIPLEIGEIPTLQVLELAWGTDSANISATRILEEQEELGNVDLKVRVTP
ncbi:putative late blight resistance protein homolog r1b-17, partial [Phtheirospermum japonicum]